MTVDTTDILLKAAEDVQSGMWCKGAMFESAGQPTTVVLGYTNLSADELGRMKRCAVGSIALATILFGGKSPDYHDACERVAALIELPADVLPPTLATPAFGEGTVIAFNDYVLVDDPFEAGQELAELFRRAAEAC